MSSLFETVILINHSFSQKVSCLVDKFTGQYSRLKDGQTSTRVPRSHQGQAQGGGTPWHDYALSSL